MSRGTTVLLSPMDNVFPQWLGTNNLFAKTQPSAHTWKYSPAHFLSPYRKPRRPPAQCTSVFASAVPTLSRWALNTAPNSVPAYPLLPKPFHPPSSPTLSNTFNPHLIMPRTLFDPTASTVSVPLHQPSLFHTPPRPHQYEKIGAFDSAEACYRKDMAADPENPQPKLDLARLEHVVRGNTDVAKELYMSILDLAPDNVPSLVALGIISADGNLAQAEEYFLKALECAGICECRLFQPPPPLPHTQHTGAAVRWG